MKVAEVAKAFSEGKIEKRTFLQILRDKLKTLVDYQELLAFNSDCTEIKITKSGVQLKLRSNLSNNAHYTGTGGGIDILFDFSQSISRAELILGMQGDYEQEDFNFLIENISGNATVFDVGANAGLFSMIIADSCPNAEIYSFEPVPMTYEKMIKNLALNENLRKNIHTFNSGFSSEQGTFDFFLPGCDEAASMQPVNDEFYLRESNANGDYTGRKKLQAVKCHVDTIDNFCRTNSIANIDVLKLDVEGGEKAALIGANNILKEFKPLVYCEMLRKHCARFNYHPNEIISHMDDLGYDCFTFHDHNFVRFVKMDENTVETNFFFLHREKHSKTISDYVKVLDY